MCGTLTLPEVLPDVAFAHQFLPETRVKGIRHIPAHTHGHALWRKMGPLDAERQRRSPSLVLPESWGELILQRASEKNLRQNPIAGGAAGVQPHLLCCGWPAPLACCTMLDSRHGLTHRGERR